KTFQVLVYLVEHRQRVVPKDELIEQIWAGAAVTDNTLEQCLAEIRKALGDDSRRPRFIKTVPRAGYRVIGEVEEIEPDRPPALPANDAAAGNQAASPTVTERGRSPWLARRPILVFFCFALVVVGLGTIYGLRKRTRPDSLAGMTLPQDPNKRTVAVMFFDNESSSPDLDWLREGLADMIITDLSRSNNLAVL